MLARLLRWRIADAAEANTAAQTTSAIRGAVDAAGAAVGTTWSVANLETVWVRAGDFLLDQIKMRVGVQIKGASQYATRLRFTFVTYTDGVICYDDGATQIKNFGLTDMALLIDYNAAGPGSCNFVALRNCVEPQLANLRIVQHRGAVGGGQVNTNAVLMDRVINADVRSVVFDGGNRGIYASGGGTNCGRSMAASPTSPATGRRRADSASTTPPPTT